MSDATMARPGAGVGANNAGPRGVVVPLLVCLAIVGAMVIAMHFEGRIWFCACKTIKVWSQDVWSSHCSQHLLDPYSITHFSHGLIFFTVFFFLLPRVPMMWRFTLAIFLAAAWEVLENSPLIINRYRESTMSLDYMGDSIVNSVGDVLCCAAGFWVARAIGWKKTLLVFAVTEVSLLFLIRDNLTLNVIMLVTPIEAIKQWQGAGHLPVP